MASQSHIMKLKNKVPNPNVLATWLPKYFFMSE